MFITADPVTELAFTILICVLMGTCLLVLVAIFRRWQQIRYSRYLASLHDRHREILGQLLSGTRMAEAIDTLRKLPPAELEVLLEPYFVKGGCDGIHLGYLLAVCTELGLVKRWQSRMAAGGGRRHPSAWRPGASASISLLGRAKGIRNLGVLRHQPSWPLLANALNDPHPDIQFVAMRSLASIRARGSFAVLLDRLQAVVLGDLPAPSQRVLQAALASFDPSCSSALLPLLRHENWNLRFLAIEILKGMVCRSAAFDLDFQFSADSLAPEVTDLLLTDLWRDTSAEVRGRTGEIIALLPNPRSTMVLHRLLLDPQWYVRLRTVQALARPRHSNALMLPGIRECLRDSHWRVREAAIHTLITLGAPGRQELYENFLRSADQSNREQIVEAMERSGLMASLVASYGEGRGGLEALIVEQLAEGAAPRGLPEVLRASSAHTRQKFQERFLPYARLKNRPREGMPANLDVDTNLQSALEFPPALAA